MLAIYSQASNEQILFNNKDSFRFVSVGHIWFFVLIMLLFVQKSIGLPLWGSTVNQPANEPNIKNNKLMDGKRFSRDFYGFVTTNECFQSQSVMWSTLVYISSSTELQRLLLFLSRSCRNTVNLSFMSEKTLRSSHQKNTVLVVNVSHLQCATADVTRLQETHDGKLKGTTVLHKQGAAWSCSWRVCPKDESVSWLCVWTMWVHVDV